MTLSPQKLRYERDLHALWHEDAGEAIAAAKAWTDADLCTAWEPSDSAWWLIRRLQRLPDVPSEGFRTALLEAASRSARAVTRETLEDEGEPPTWLSGIQARNALSEAAGFHEISFRGLTVLGGQTGLGKSKSAMRSALLACANPETAVVYLNTELDGPTLGLYASQAAGMQAAEILHAFPNFYPVTVPAGSTFELVVREVVASIPESATRVVIVADTINTLVEKTQTAAESYFELLRRYAIWMMESRMQTEGRIGWLAVSELNKDDKVLGVKLDKWADMVMRLRSGDGEGEVLIDIPKGRYSGQRDLGTYRLNWRTCEMEPL